LLTLLLLLLQQAALCCCPVDSPQEPPQHSLAGGTAAAAAAASGAGVLLLLLASMSESSAAAAAAADVSCKLLSCTGPPTAGLNSTCEWASTMAQKHSKTSVCQPQSRSKPRSSQHSAQLACATLTLASVAGKAFTLSYTQQCIRGKILLTTKILNTGY
jgi:hypothetical protein